MIGAAPGADREHAEKEEKGRPRDLLRMLARARPHAAALGFAFACLLVSGGIGLVFPAAVGMVVDAALVERSAHRLDLVSLGLVALFAVQGGVHFARTAILVGAGSRILAELRGDVFGRLLLQAPSFFETRRVGELLSRLGSDVASVESVLTSDLSESLKDAFVLAGGLAIVFVVHTQLALVMLAAVPPVIAIAFLMGRRLEKLSTKTHDELAAANIVAEESLSQVRVVQAFVREQGMLSRYRERILNTAALARRQGRMLGALAGTVSFLGFSAVALVLWFGNRLVLDGELTAGQLTSFVFYTFVIASAIGSLASTYGTLRRAMGSCRRVFEILDLVPAIADAPDAAPFARPRGAVSFRGVSFSYPSAPERRALDGIDVEVEPGEVVALVGRSGAGKSTLVSLLSRFWDPTEGAVSIDGRDVRSLRLADLRRSIGIVPQETLLFGGTIRENLLFGRPGASEEEMRAAARAARADGFVEALAGGYDTVVGERGVKLSMGQRQRIAIARCFLEDPAILVLDEATSSLDSESERHVTEALDALFRGRTTFVIAHRLSTVLRAHRILVLDEGRIVEQGDHGSLLARGGLYRALFELQLLAAPAR